MARASRDGRAATRLARRRRRAPRDRGFRRGAGLGGTRGEVGSSLLLLLPPRNAGGFGLILPAVRILLGAWVVGVLGLPWVLVVPKSL